jgi:hypothetical protein
MGIVSLPLGGERKAGTEIMFAPKHIDSDYPVGSLDEAGALWQFHTANYSIALFAEHEDVNPSDSFDNPKDVEFASDGDPAHWFCAVVCVYGPDGAVIGMDMLGGCSYHSFREFYSAHRWQYSRTQRKWITDPKSRAWKACEAQRPRRSDGSRMDGHYFPQMVRAALNEARATELTKQFVAA